MREFRFFFGLVTTSAFAQTGSLRGRVTDQNGAVVGRPCDALGDSPEDLQEALGALAGPSAGARGGQNFIDGFSGGQLPSKNSIREIRITKSGPIIGNITSPLFGQSNQPSDAGGFGFSESANNRRFELQTRFTF